MQVTEMFPLLAQQSQHYCLVRSMSHAEIPHVSAAHMLLTGQMDGSRNNNTPFMGSVISKLRPSSSVMPSHVWLHNMKTGTNKIPRYSSGLNDIGYEHAALHVGYELDNPSDPEFRVKAFDPAEGLFPRADGNALAIAGRDAVAKASDRRIVGTRAVRPVSRAGSAIGHGACGAAGVRSKARVPKRYGTATAVIRSGQYLLMSRRLIEAGVRLVTVTGWPGLAPGETQPTITQVWDTHDIRYKKGDSMFGNGPFGMKWSLPRLDQGVSALLEDLAQRGLLEDTLVVMTGEFGRTPKFEGKGGGRGHWPHAFTSLLAGGGVRGGTVYGASDKDGAYVEQGRPNQFRRLRRHAVRRARHPARDPLRPRRIFVAR